MVVSSRQAPRWPCCPGGRGLSSPAGGTELWPLSRTGLSERRFRAVFSSLPMSLLRSSGCFRSKEAKGGKAQPGVFGLAPGR